MTINELSQPLRPEQKPNNPNFSSGPCSKRPGYDINLLDLSTQGRSHRAPIGKQALERCCTETAELLGLPDGYRVGVVPASDTGAVEMAMWSLLGERPIDMLAWESFGAGWVTDVKQQLKLENVRLLEAPYGELPNLKSVNFNHDVVFTWNGTTSGVRVPSGDWIPDDRSGLTICDATSAVFAMALPWEKLDVVTFSWQKVLGGEGAHGMLILSPRAVARLENYVPPWPLPKIFRMTKNGKLIEGIFKGATINTPSMLCVADYLDALSWVRQIGGVKETIRRTSANVKVIEDFVEKTPWLEFLARKPDEVSSTSVCLVLKTPDGCAEKEVVSKMLSLLEQEQVAYDIGSYRDAPNGLRIWCGATIETADVEALIPWIQWAYDTAVS
ncbi:phosphoserine transaminase [Marinibactrum halimedae]|uniref:phosphoserine transaminase n=1 Tax=Marinibactrum halimedae TaxID=1444977 RepID=A0AA37TDC5_9GAMM|nr:phosphoserine transaminase [Marinibactrum halimedae]MCD9459512.1 phosphoserine transaminase [Marinibactrum halimedae]GLS28166.1 phosphoserine aminotransferase [Marinibactrum halimedae]